MATLSKKQQLEREVKSAMYHLYKAHQKLGKTIQGGHPTEVAEALCLLRGHIAELVGDDQLCDNTQTPPGMLQWPAGNKAAQDYHAEVNFGGLLEHIEAQYNDNLQ